MSKLSIKFIRAQDGSETTVACSAVHKRGPIVHVIDETGLSIEQFDLAHGRVYVMNDRGNTITGYKQEQPAPDDFERDTLSSPFPVV